jgi:hypothetical protein
MESKMILWECTYRIFDGYKYYYVKDWVYSTSKPSNNTIGHYWKHLFNYPVDCQNVCIADQGIDCNQYKLSETPF